MATDSTLAADFKKATQDIFNGFDRRQPQSYQLDTRKWVEIVYCQKGDANATLYAAPVTGTEPKNTSGEYNTDIIVSFKPNTEEYKRREDLSKEIERWSATQLPREITLTPVSDKNAGEGKTTYPLVKGRGVILTTTVKDMQFAVLYSRK